MFASQEREREGRRGGGGKGGRERGRGKDTESGGGYVSQVNKMSWEWRKTFLDLPILLCAGESAPFQSSRGGYHPCQGLL